MFAFLKTFWQDLRFGARQLRRKPGFAVVAIVTLALGIGANTAIFSVVNAVLLQPLPYRNPGCLVYISEFWPHEAPVHTVPTPDFANWHKHNNVFQGLAAYGGDRAIDLTNGGEAEPIQGINVSRDFFALLGVQPFLGRSFLPQEEQTGGRKVVMLAHSLWQECFGSDSRIIGKSITLDGQSYAVIGVLPAGFRFPDNDYHPQLFLPDVAASVANWHSPQYFRLQPVIARLKPGVTSAAAKVQLMTLVRRTASEEPLEFAHMRAGMEIRVIPLHKRLSGDARPLLLILLGAVGLILLIACVNVACLELGRAAGRQKEMAVRVALGARRVRVARQLLTESVLLAALGGAAALPVGFLGVRILLALKPQQIPHMGTIGIDGWVLAFTLVIAFITGIFFGVAPALSASKLDLNEMLKEVSPSGVTSPEGHRVQSALVVAELALASILLVGSGLLTRTFIHLITVDPGCDTRHLLTLRIALPTNKYSTPDQRTGVFQQVLQRARTLPGIESAAMGSGIPISGWAYLLGTVVEGEPVPPRGLRPDIPHDIVTPCYFRALDIPLMAGRSFNEHDKESSPPVAVVNQAFVQQFFPGQNTIGKRVSIGSAWREIVGVVGNVRQQGPERASSPEVYSPYLQDSDPVTRMVLVIRTREDPRALAAEARKAVAAAGADLMIYDVATMQQRLSDSIAPQRFNMLLIGIFAALALILAAVGIYGVISYSVSQRTHEIGIRMALGAQKADVLRMVIRRGAILILTGAGIGLGGSLALTRFLSSLLYGVRPNDPLTFIVVSLVLSVVALAASYIPARRATKVDPVTALRYE